MERSANLGIDEILENFSTMMVEEYLMKKGLKDTLKTFRSEWKRPDEVIIALINHIYH